MLPRAPLSRRPHSCHVLPALALLIGEAKLYTKVYRKPFLRGITC